MDEGRYCTQICLSVELMGFYLPQFVHETIVNVPIPHYLQYVRLPYITYLNYSCPLFEPEIALRCAQNNLGVKKVLGPSKISLEMPHYVFCP